LERVVNINVGESRSCKLWMYHSGQFVFKYDVNSSHLSSWYL